MAGELRAHAVQLCSPCSHPSQFYLHTLIFILSAFISKADEHNWHCYKIISDMYTVVNSRLNNFVPRLLLSISWDILKWQLHEIFVNFFSLLELHAG